MKKEDSRINNHPLIVMKTHKIVGEKLVKFVFLLGASKLHEWRFWRKNGEVLV